jgi:hypothetical protein
MVVIIEAGVEHCITQQREAGLVTSASIEAYTSSQWLYSNNDAHQMHDRRMLPCRFYIRLIHLDNLSWLSRLFISRKQIVLDDEITSARLPPYMRYGFQIQEAKCAFHTVLGFKSVGDALKIKSASVFTDEVDRSSASIIC